MKAIKGATKKHGKEKINFPLIFCFNSVFEDKRAMHVSVSICLRLLSQQWVNLIILIGMSWKRYFVKACVINADYEECEKRVEDRKRLLL